MDGVFAFARTRRARQRIGQAGVFGHRPRLPAVEHVGKAARHAVRGIEDGVLGKVRIAEGGRDVGMAEQPGGDAQALAAADRDRRMAMTVIPKSE